MATEKGLTQKALFKHFLFFCKNNTLLNFDYHLIGEGAERDGRLFDYAVSIKAPIQRMHFHGKLSHPDAMEILRTATLMIHPSLEEANSIAIIESMALGVPVIASKFSKGIYEQLKHNRGFLCNTSSYLDICYQMESCIKNPAICIKLSLSLPLYAKKAL